MKTLNGKNMSALLSEFERNCLGQYECLLDIRTERYNALYKKMLLIEEELKQRGCLDELTSFFANQNPQVRFQAAAATLAIVPEKARSVLQLISARKEYPTAGYANGMLRRLADGSYVPK